MANNATILIAPKAIASLSFSTTGDNPIKENESYKKTKLDLNSLMEHYFNLNHNNTVVYLD